MAKGSSFEREICVLLSKWWTNGKRDDIFWRTAGSGARAKTRSKTKQATFGQYGDVQATDPLGQPLIDLCSIELKRGYSKNTFADVIDKLDGAKEQLFESFIMQASSDCSLSVSYSWMLIIKRDRRKPLIFIPRCFYKDLKNIGCKLDDITHISLYFTGKEQCKHEIFGAPLTEFLEVVRPIDIGRLHESLDYI